jgi:aminoglycoside phosphotransferase (APT) family kinase protein
MASDARREFDAALDAALRRALGRGLASATRLSGGASQETWAVDAGVGADAEPLILRRRPGGASFAQRAEGERSPSGGAGSGMALDLAAEAQLLGLAAQAGVPVPAVRYVLTPDDRLGSGYLMQRLEGETIPRKILRDEELADTRPRLARQCGEILARIHAVPRASLPPLPAAPAAVQWRQYRDLYDGFDWPHPVFELAFRWIEERLSGAAHASDTLVHGDFRHGNLVIGPDGVRGVLDWELAHRGDPLEDLGWLCVNSWRFGNIDLPVGGFGVREDLFAGYESAGGQRVDPERVRFWEVVGSLKWGIMCMMMLSVFERGIDRSVERAAIGRRASEAEIDLLALIAGER